MMKQGWTVKTDEEWRKLVNACENLLNHYEDAPMFIGFVMSFLEARGTLTIPPERLPKFFIRYSFKFANKALALNPDDVKLAALVDGLRECI